jgi:hypothetical protein
MEHKLNKERTISFLSNYFAGEFWEVHYINPVVKRYLFQEGNFYSTFRHVPGQNEEDLAFDFVHTLVWRCSYGKTKTNAKGK